MASQPRESHLTVLWLLPAEAERQVLHELISRLAQQCDAPIFEPHLTLGYSTPMQFDEIRSNPLRLRVLEIDQSTQYTKTLFVRLEETGELRALRRSFASDLKPTYDPHISLLYRTLPEARRVELARSSLLPFATIAFDALALIRAPEPTASRADVEAWETIGTRKLN
jgi:2'-5' RNA ligase